MSDSFAPRPTGSDPEMFFHQETHDLTRGPQSQMRNSSTVKFRHGPKGIFAKAAPQSSGGGKSTLYKITTLFEDDYVGAKVWSFSSNSATGSEVKIAKCIGARMLASEFIDNTAISYVYTNDNLRKASAVGFADEWQVVHARYSTDNVGEHSATVVPPGFMLVTRVRNGSGVLDDNGNQILLCEFSPQRFWAYQANQSGVL